MAYAFRYIEDKGSYYAETLVELTRDQASKLQGKDCFREGRHVYEPTHSTVAHKWVRDGGHHETTLWIDEGRIRRA
jgi:hypothetical protein